MEEKLTKQLNIAIGVVFVIAGAVLAWSAFNRQSAATADQSASSTPEAQQPSAPSAPAADVSGEKSLSLAQNFESWTPDAKLDDAKIKSLHLAVKGSVAKAELLVRASEGGNALTKWDSVYFKLNDTGGHLFRPDTLPAPAGEDGALFYDLHDLPYLANLPYSEDREPDHGDLTALLKDGTHPLATLFISSLRQSSIDEATLYYTCADGSDCSVDLAK